MNQVAWTSSNIHPAFRRGTQTIHGFDCIDHPEACPHEPKCLHGDAGRHGTDELYVVSDGKDALVFEATDNLVGGRYYTLRLHAGEPIDEDSIRHPAPRECFLLESKKCFDGGWWGNYADEVAARFAWTPDGKPAEPELFWKALESEFIDLRDRAYRLRGTAKRCEHCAGRGYTGDFA